jgi:hypothetical protein
MRNDMPKIIIKGFRYLDDLDNKEARKKPKNSRDRVNFPNKVPTSLSRRNRPGLKRAPLVRWLEKQVGRPWNVIYSEFCESFQDRHAKTEKVRSLLRYYVHSDGVEIRDGWPYVIGSYGSDLQELRKEHFYVDKGGILRRPPQDKKSPRQKAHEARRALAPILLDPLTAAIKIDSEWFIADLEQVPVKELLVKEDSYSYKSKQELEFSDALWKKVYGPLIKNGIIARTPEWWERKKFYNNAWLYAPKIRPMTKREIKQRIPEDVR